MNKSVITNLLALTCVVAGFLLDNVIVKTVGFFAVSGAITNWLAVHMLFEKVPGLYGSGIVPTHFESFKKGIHHLVMNQFFTADNIQQFMSQSSTASAINLAPVIEKVDLSPTFDSLIAVIQESSFGQMLGMFGGVEALEPMRQPFMDKMRVSITDISQDPSFAEALQSSVGNSESGTDFHTKIGSIVEQRLEQLTPQMVKEIVQEMIKQHLGWLVVWGGVFGGLIGLLTAFFA